MLITDFEPLIAGGQILLYLARLADEQGNLEQAKQLYRRAFLQGLIIRSLKEPHQQPDLLDTFNLPSLTLA